MGIFGYNEKVFHKNTRKFIEALNEVAEQCRICLASDSTDELDTSIKVFDHQTKLFDAMDFPGKQHCKDLEIIDGRIKDVINRLRTDVAEREFRRLMLRTEILYYLISEYRKHGSILDEDTEVLERRERLVEYKAEIHRLTDEEEKARSRMQELIDSARRIDDSGDESAMYRIELEYSALDNTVEGLRSIIDRLTQECNSLEEYVKAYSARRSR